MTTVPRTGQAAIDNDGTVLCLKAGDVDVWIELMPHLLSIGGRLSRLLRSAPRRMGKRHPELKRRVMITSKLDKPQA